MSDWSSGLQIFSDGSCGYISSPGFDQWVIHHAKCGSNGSFAELWDGDRGDKGEEKKDCVQCPCWNLAYSNVSKSQLAFPFEQFLELNAAWDAYATHDVNVISQGHLTILMYKSGHAAGSKLHSYWSGSKEVTDEVCNCKVEVFGLVPASLVGIFWCSVLAVSSMKIE